MNIKVVNEWRQHTEVQTTVSKFVADSMIDYDADGQVERAQATASNISRAFGRLVETLAEKGIISLDEVATISGSHSDTLSPN